MYPLRPSCTNCGKFGHHYRSCNAPITSYGIIAFHAKYLDTTKPIVNEKEQSLEFLLIQRRNSIGFIEIIRCKFKPTDIEYILEQIEGTTEDERNMLRNFSFQELWKVIWGKDAENKNYRADFYQAKQRFEYLVSGYYVNDKFIHLSSLLDSVPIKWKTPEWGFPKGRRNPYESDEDCAIREFCEETRLESRDFLLLKNILPIRETFLGNNHIRYEHVYFLAWIPEKESLQLTLDETQAQEVGNIGWFTYENAIERIRDTNLEKRDILTQAYNVLKSVCPLRSQA